MQKKKTLILLSGGGMNCVFGAGFLYGLWKHELPEDLYIIAGSGNACNASYFVSEQIEFPKEAWLKYLNGNKMISFRRFWKIWDIDYLVDYVFKKVFTLNIQVLQDSKINLYIPALNTKTGKIDYFSNKDKTINWYEVMRAATAIPVLYGKKINLKNEFYTDSNISSKYASYIDLIERINPDKIICLDNSNQDKSFITKILFYKSEKVNKCNKKNFQQKFKEKTIIVKPSYSIGSLNTDENKLKQYWQKGFEQGLETGKKLN